MLQNSPNRLSKEKSPYLLQHAYNPVDWYSWSDESFKLAKRLDKPIFLSIGYSTCHWCHVMERESFENETIANLLNRAFICIKVDREERPDIDSVYMNVCQMLTGSGGWPLTIIMTPDKKPFYAATYIPPRNFGNRIGLPDLISRISELWKTKRDIIYESAESIIDKLQDNSSSDESIPINENIFHGSARILESNYDRERGGFGSSPKFPSPHNLSFLLRYSQEYNSQSSKNIAYHTLKAMREGGIYDHIGYGFHRYSTDRNWLLPHFEKMLYDQAGLLMAYTDAYQITHSLLSEQIIEEIVTYIERTMLSPDGAFYSAEDADSEGVEGKFYLWTTAEICELLNENADEIISLFNMRDNGNFNGETEYNNIFNIPHLKPNTDEIVINSLKEHELINTLYLHRKKRIHPIKDDKILTDWNGFIIAALAKAGYVLKNSRYIQLAERGIEFILNTMVQDHNQLYHRYRDGDASIHGMLDDYAYLIFALMETYFATGKIEYLDDAFAFLDTVIDKFYDAEKGGFFQTDKFAEKLIVRNKDIYDGAMPSGNSIMLLNLIRMTKIKQDAKYLEIVDNTIKCFSSTVMNYPAGYNQFLNALFGIYGKSTEILIVGNRTDNNFETLIDSLRSHYSAFSTILYLDNRRELDNRIEWTKSIEIKKGVTQVYICKNFSCKLPITEPAQLIEALKDS